MTITSGGNRNPVNADFGGDHVERGDASLIQRVGRIDVEGRS
jgi:hypothetical protein